MYMYLYIFTFMVVNFVSKVTIADVFDLYFVETKINKYAIYIIIHAYIRYLRLHDNKIRLDRI